MPTVADNPADALRNGALIDVSVTAREAGIRWPADLTRAASAALPPLTRATSPFISSRRRIPRWPSPPGRPSSLLSRADRSHAHEVRKVPRPPNSPGPPACRRGQRPRRTDLVVLLVRQPSRGDLRRRHPGDGHPPTRLGRSPNRLGKLWPRHHGRDPGHFRPALGHSDLHEPWV